MNTLPDRLPQLLDGFAGDVITHLSACNAPAWLVGGAVRDAALGLPYDDIDIATTMLPADVMSAIERAGWAAHPTGIDHGTVTAVRGCETVEITTLRRDVSTDGRRATVAFSTSLAEDAARRDFTINALYVDANGVLQDPLGTGFSDLAQRRLRFIGTAENRIKEDYLRILRFFRFAARYTPPDSTLDAEGLSACGALADGLAQIAGERIWNELRKLLNTASPLSAVTAMVECGVMAHIVPEATPEVFARLLVLEEGKALPATLRLAALAAHHPDALQGLPLSRAERREVLNALEAARSNATAGELGYRGRIAARGHLLLRHALAATTPSAEEWACLTKGQAAQFPLRAKDLPPTLKGAEIGKALRDAERMWIDNGFTGL